MINLILALVVLAHGTHVAVRPSTTQPTGLIDALVTALALFFLSSGMSWNSGLPVFVWWLLAAWSAAIVGIQASRFSSREESPIADA